MKIILKDVELKMWEKVEMPEAEIGTDGKVVKDENGKIKNTGKMKEYTMYTFRDLLGEKLEIMSAKNDFRQFENSQNKIEVTLELRKTSFQGKTETKVSLVSVSEI